jgi:DNA-binding transcriptional LysR family regulator
MEDQIHDNRIFTFYTVAKLRSFTEAAKVLHITQPAVSFQIRQLQDLYGTKLIDTRNRQVVLTKAGVTLFDYAQRIIMHYREMDRVMNELIGKASKCLYLGASTAPGRYILPSIVADFQNECPDDSAFLTVANTDKVIRLLKEDKIDIAVIGQAVKEDNIVNVVFMPDELVLIFSPNSPIAGKDELDKHIFLKTPLIVREAGSATLKDSLQVLEKSGITKEHISKTLVINNGEAIKRAVEAGIGVSILSKSAVLREIELGLLKALPISDPAFDRKFYFVFKARNYREEVIRQFIKFAKNYGPKNSSPP